MPGNYLNMGRVLCMITIGQSPRTDMFKVISTYLPEGVRLIEKGLLDNLSAKDIHALSPENSKDTLVSRLCDGSSVTLDSDYVVTALAQLIKECQTEEIDMILLACTGKFAPFDSSIPIIYPDYLLSHVVKGIFKVCELGIVVPLLDQRHSISEKWTNMGFTCSVLACSPYGLKTEDLIKISREMDLLPVKAIVLDCMGYTDEMKKIMSEYTSKLIIVARNVVFSSLAEML